MRFDLLCLYLLRNGHDVALAPQRSLFRCRGQSCLDWLCGSAAGSVTDSVYVALLVVYHIVDAWWWLLTVPLSQAESASALFRWSDGKLRADQESVCVDCSDLVPKSPKDLENEELGGEWIVFYLYWKSGCRFPSLSFGTKTARTEILLKFVKDTNAWFHSKIPSDVILAHEVTNEWWMKWVRDVNFL